MAITIEQLYAQANGAAALARQSIEASQKVAQTMQNVMVQMANQNKLLASIASGKRGDVQRIEDLPGKRIPFDVIIEIPIGANQTGPFSQPYTVSPDGPFVAVTRSATFLSALTFQVQEAGTNNVTTYQGRSYGRYRPISSVLDLMDAQQGHNNPAAIASPGTFQTQLTSKTDKSGFRTMAWNGTIQVSNTNFKRQSQAVPSSLWAPGFEGSMQLPVLDFYNIGETIEVVAQSNHVNNPPFGNIQTITGALPFLSGQYDSQEGIGYAAGINAGQSDLITRQPDGILIVCLSGFRITSVPGIE